MPMSMDALREESSAVARCGRIGIRVVLVCSPGPRPAVKGKKGGKGETLSFFFFAGGGGRAGALQLHKACDN